MFNKVPLSIQERLEIINSRTEYISKIEKDCVELAKRISTSSSGSVHGRRILKQIKMISVSNKKTDVEVEYGLLSEADKVGANGVINVRISHHRGGYVSAQGDAVLLTP